MKKIVLLLFFTLFISKSSFSQKITAEAKLVFDVVAFDRTKIGEYEKIQKWVVPIRYKIYGDTSAYLVKEVDSNFSYIRKLTALDIKRTYNDDEANFMIVFGKTPNFFEAYTMNKMPLNSPGNYRKRVNKNGEIYWAQNLFNIEAYGSKAIVKNAIKRQLIKVLGFQKTIAISNSFFSTAPNLKNKFDNFDSHIISTLYLPALKAGMTKDEVDKILTNELAQP
jgi:hypothetical protein